MKIGITGTRNGMTESQRSTVSAILLNFPNSELHHGDCCGVDIQVAEIATSIGLTTICHPPINPSLRAFHTSTEIRDPYTYFVRNRHIVDESDIILVIPKETSPQKKGGTWYTHDYALKLNKQVFVIYPN